MTPVEERIDHAAVAEMAEAYVSSFDNVIGPGNPVEHDLERLARAYLALLTEHSARGEALQGWEARDAGDGLSTIERGIEIDDNLERMVGPIPYERAEEIEAWLEALSESKETP